MPKMDVERPGRADDAQPAPPRPRAPQRSPWSLRTSDGWLLRGDRILPAGPTRARAVLGHAMMADRRTMDRPAGGGLASVLAGGGIEVLNVDLRGHGESGPDVSAGGSWTYDDFVLRDAPELVRAARALTPPVPVVVVGHSLMGHASLIAAGLSPESAPDAIVAIAANLWAPRFEPSRTRRWAKASLLAAWGLTTRAWPRGAGPRLGSTVEPWPYVRQFMRMYFRNRIASADGRHDYQAALRSVAIPVLSVTSSGDALLARPEAVARFLASVPAARLTHERASRLGHMGLVLSPRARPVWDRIAGWIAAVAEARP